MQSERRARNETILHEIETLSPEERLAFRSCMQKEAVINGGIPVALMSSMSGYFLMSISPFRQYAKFMAAFGGISGYILGKGLYGLTCLQKSVPRLRPLLDPNQGLLQSDKQHDENVLSSDMLLPEYRDQSDSVIDFGEPISSFDSYTSPDESGDSLSTLEADIMESRNTQQSVTYDELRQRNRAENRPKISSVPRDRSMIVRQAKETDPVDGVTPSGQKTKYGDVWG